MSNSLQKKVEVATQAKARAASALERLDALEAQLPQIIQAINNALNGANNALSDHTEKLDALIELVGRSSVDGIINNNRLTRERANADLKRAGIANAIKSGADGRGGLKTEDVVSEDSLVTGIESDADGKIIEPGYVQFMFSQVKPEFKSLLLGKKIGDTVPTPGMPAEDGADAKAGTLEVTGIFRQVSPDPEKLKELAAAAETPKPAEAAPVPSEGQ